MHKKKIFIISNESISENSNSFFCDNLDMKSIPEGLNETLEVNLLARTSNIYRKYKINKVKIELAKNIFLFIKKILKTIKKKENSKFFVISISPYTFVAILLLSLFRIRPVVYLRSDGYEEYSSIIGVIGKFIYHIMFEITAIFSNFISCRKHILRNKKGIVVSPSHLNEKWMKNFKKVDIEKINLLYVGRIRVEKGIFSFLKLFEKLNKNISLSIVCSGIDHSKINIRKNIHLIDIQSEDSLIEIYDKNNIFILPSFTEGHPQVLDEALSRLRPVVIFPEISHVTRNRDGVFVSERNSKSLSKKIKYIIQEYENIHKKMALNRLPTKKLFLKELKEIIK